MARLVETTYSSGPNDKLITVDAYEVKDADVKNSTPNSGDKADSKKMEDVKSGNQKETIPDSDMVKNANDKKLGLEVNPSSLLDGVIASNPELSSAMKSLPKELQTNLTKVNKTIEKANGIVNGVVPQLKNIASQSKTIMDNATGVYNKVVTTIDGITNIVKHADIGTLTGLGTMINTLSGAELPMSFIDKTGLSNLATNLIRESSELKMPNTFTALEKTINDIPLLNGIVKNLLPDIIEKSNTDLLKQIADSKVAVDVNKILPSFKNDFVSSYTKPLLTNTNNIIKEFNDINNSFTKIDPSWKTCRNVGSDSTINATVWSNASQDFKDIAKTAITTIYTPINTTDPVTLNNAINTSPEKYMCLASEYGNIDTSKEIIKNNPTLVFSTLA